MFGKGVSTTELKSAARQLASGLRLARSEALTQRRETFLVLDVAGRRFRVDQDPKEHPLPRDVELKLFTAQKDLVDEKVGSIRFFPDGGSNGGRITVASGERKYEVDVDWLTGRVAILDLNGNAASASHAQAQSPAHTPAFRCSKCSPPSSSWRSSPPRCSGCSRAASPTRPPPRSGAARC